MRGGHHDRGDVRCNAALIRHVLDDERGPLRDIAVLNAAMAIVAADFTERLEEGIEAAVRSVDDGDAGTRLEMLLKASGLAREEEQRPKHSVAEYGDTGG